MRRMMVSSWATLALRFIGRRPFAIVVEVKQCTFDVGGLFPFVAATEQERAQSSNHGVVDAISRSPVDSQFAQALTQGLGVSEIARCKTVDSCGDLGLRPGVGELREPLVESIRSCA